MSQAAQVEQVLEQINKEMIRLDLWQSTMPSKEALRSAEPFCCDTLTVAQWLEFILLPKNLTKSNEIGTKREKAAMIAWHTR